MKTLRVRNSKNCPVTHAVRPIVVPFGDATDDGFERSCKQIEMIVDQLLPRSCFQPWRRGGCASADMG